MFGSPPNQPQNLLTVTKTTQPVFNLTRQTTRSRINGEKYVLYEYEDKAMPCQAGGGYLIVWHSFLFFSFFCFCIKTKPALRIFK